MYKINKFMQSKQKFTLHKLDGKYYLYKYSLWILNYRD